MKIIKLLEESIDGFLFDAIMDHEGNEFKVKAFLNKEDGELFVSTEELAQSLGFENSKDFLGCDESLDVYNELQKEYIYTPLQMFEIKKCIALIDDKALRESLISKLAIE